jgi:glycosyltransferase involved in cell wall biosynthesis
VPEERVFTLPNSVDLERFVAQPKNPSLLRRYGFDGSRVILTLGRLASRERCKGFDEVIEAMPALLKTFSDLKYLIVGDGPDRSRLTAKVSGMGLSDAVVFAGRIPETEKVAHYNLADAYVMPSSGEGFGIALIEAAACGIPVVGSNADASREALLDGRLGRLVDPRRPSQLIEAVTETLNRRAGRGRNDLIDTFSTASFCRRVDEWTARMAGGAAGISTPRNNGKVKPTASPSQSAAS